MSVLNLLTRYFTRERIATTPIRHKPSRPNVRLRLAELENRSTPAVAHVTSLADSGPGTLRDAIEYVHQADADADQIYIDVGGEIELLSPLPTILAANIESTVDNPGFYGTTIARSLATGTPDFRLLTFLGTPSSVKNLAFFNGRSDQGGAIYASDLTVDKCYFVMNFATGNGGAIAARSVTMTNSWVQQNSAQGNGGGIYVQGTGGATSTISSSDIEINIAVNGGGIYSWTNGSLNINADTSIMENIAAFGGYGGNIYSMVSNLYITGGSTTNIWAGDAVDGGNIYTSSTQFVSIDCMVDGGDPGLNDPSDPCGVVINTLSPGEGGYSINWDLMGDRVRVDGVVVWAP